MIIDEKRKQVRQIIEEINRIVIEIEERFQNCEIMLTS